MGGALSEGTPGGLLVSACLLGRACRYDGGTVERPGVRREVERLSLLGWPVLAVCPEELGGLGTPRPAAHLAGGDGEAVLAGAARVVLACDGSDVTAQFVAGARAALAAGAPAQMAILKARSPSCGFGRVTIDGDLRPGAGVFAALLRQAGVVVRVDEALEVAKCSAS